MPPKINFYVLYCFQQIWFSAIERTSIVCLQCRSPGEIAVYGVFVCEVIHCAWVVDMFFLSPNHHKPYSTSQTTYVNVTWTVTYWSELSRCSTEKRREIIICFCCSMKPCCFLPLFIWSHCLWCTLWTLQNPILCLDNSMAIISSGE